MIFRRSRFFLLFLGVLLLCSSQLFAQSTSSSDPKVLLFSPVENSVSVKSKILFKGQAEGAAQLFLNDEELKLEDDGRFFKKVELEKADDYNYFLLKAVSSSGAESQVTRQVYYKKSDVGTLSPGSSKPFLQLSFPPDESLAKKPNIVFKGKVIGTTTLLLNSVTINIEAQGDFEIPYTLTQENDYESIRLVALSEDGSQQTALMRRIYYQASKDHEIAILVDSPDNKHVSEQEVVTLEGRVLNAVFFTINEVPVTLNNSGEFKVDVVLDKVNDTNTFVLAANNGQSQAVSVIRDIYYKVPQDPVPDLVPDEPVVVEPEVVDYKIPSIVMESPPNNFVTYQNRVTLEGRAEHTKELFINHRIVKLDENQSFSEVFDLETIGKYVFNMYAIGEKGLNTTQLVKVFRVAEKQSLELSEGGDISSDFAKKLMQKVSLDLAGTDIRDVLAILSRKGELNLVADKNLAGDVYVSLQDVTILDAIDFVLGSQGFAYKIVDNTIMVGSKAALSMPTRLETKILRLNNIPASVVESVLEDHLVKGESIQIQQNLLILTADSKKMDRLIGIIKKLDHDRVPQIILEAQILEVSKSILDNLGVSWSDAYGIGISASQKDGTFTYASSFSLSTVISMLESEGKARVLAKPRIKAIHGEKAEIFIGDKVPYTELSVGAGGTIAESISFIDSGINLTILPEINTHTQEIKIKIQPEVSFINGYAGEDKDIPLVRTRKVNTTVFVRNNSTVLIGGLFNSSDSEIKPRSSLLSKIPIFGRLFKKRNKVKGGQTELVIAITPQIINDEFKESIPLPSVD